MNGEDGINLEVGKQVNPPNDQAHDPEDVLHGAQPSQPGGGIIVTEDIARKLLQLPYNLMAEKRGDHWLLTEPETDLLPPPMTRVLQKYSLQLSEKYPDGTLLLLGLAISFGTRAGIDVAKKQARVKAAASKVDYFKTDEPEPGPKGDNDEQSVNN